MFLHAMRVMLRIESEDEEINCIAILHDIIEDSENPHITKEDLIAMGFSQRVVDAVVLLTRDPAVPYLTYIEGLKNNLDALTIKKSDIRDNSDIRRSFGTEENFIRRAKKYTKAYSLVTSYIEEIQKNAINNR